MTLSILNFKLTCHATLQMLPRQTDRYIRQGGFHHIIFKRNIPAYRQAGLHDVHMNKKKPSHRESFKCILYFLPSPSEKGRG
jgi:hypothetical protein